MAARLPSGPAGLPPVRRASTCEAYHLPIVNRPKEAP